MASVVDQETLAALKVLKGGGKEIELSEKILAAIEKQTALSTKQNEKLVAAIKEQNELLRFMDLSLQKTVGTKPSVVVVDKELSAKEEEEMAAARDAELAAAIAKARKEGKAEAKASMPAAVEEAPVVVAPEKPIIPPKIILGPWGFVETKVAVTRRNRIENAKGFAEKDDDEMLKLEDALFGKATGGKNHIGGGKLVGDSFGEHWEEMRNKVDQYGKLKAPKWSSLGDPNVRSYLPQLRIGGKTDIKLNSGVYYLTIKYQNPHSPSPDMDDELADEADDESDAALVIGEIAFDNKGRVLAPGADWKKLFAGDAQDKVPVPIKDGKFKWYSSKISEPWRDGDTLKFKIDTHENTVGYTIQSDGESEVRTGWMLTNVLTFTNNRCYPNKLSVFAYCGGASCPNDTSFQDVTFQVIDTR